jgi:hypothetical protein
VGYPKRSAARFISSNHFVVFFKFDNSGCNGHYRSDTRFRRFVWLPNPDPPCSSCPMTPQPIAGTYLAANTSGMAKKPEPPQPTSWNVYKVAAKATWLGTVEAPDAATAIEKAAAEFNVDTWRLLAVARRK